MLRHTALTVLLLALPVLAQGTVAPSTSERIEEGPHRRAVLMPGMGEVHFAITTANAEAQKFFDQGIAQLHGGWDFEAERSFRQVAALDPDCAMAYWGMALASKSRGRAVAFAWEAFRRVQASKRERLFIEAYARWFGAEREPETVLVDAERGARRAIAKPVTQAARARLLEDLAAIAKTHPGDAEAHAFLLREHAQSREQLSEDRIDALSATLFATSPRHPGHRYRVLLARSLASKKASLESARLLGLCAPGIARMWSAAGPPQARLRLFSAAARSFNTAARVDHAFMKSTGALPYEVEGYADNLATLARMLTTMQRPAEAYEVARTLTRMPHHPHGRCDPVAEAQQLLVRIKRATMEYPNGWRPSDAIINLDGLDAFGPASWSPESASPFKLHLGKGGQVALGDFKGRPVVVVFFLGFGCVHCVEQLQALQPRIEEFAQAGIELVTIGTDTVDQVKASIQRKIEADVPPMAFPILCDPEHEVFKAWRCWDDFTNEALHGTFLIDDRGRVRWRDISIEPFMDTEFLLKESKRLLAIR